MEIIYTYLLLSFVLHPRRMYIENSTILAYLFKLFIYTVSLCSYWLNQFKTQFLYSDRYLVKERKKLIFDWSSPLPNFSRKTFLAIAILFFSYTFSFLLRQNEWNDCWQKRNRYTPFLSRFGYECKREFFLFVVICFYYFHSVGTR